MLSIGNQTFENFDDAIMSLRGVASEAGSNATDFKALGEVLALNGEVDEAICAYRSALELSADSAVRTRLAELLMRGNILTEARELFDAAAANAEALKNWGARLLVDYNELADANFAAGDLSAALDCHDAALKLAPGFSDAKLGAALKVHIDHVVNSLTPAIAAAASGGPTYHAAAVVWGEKFVRNFLEYCLSSLLAPGNIPFLAEREKVLFIVYSTPESIEAIDTAPQFRKLQDYAEVLFVEIPEHLIVATKREDIPPNLRYTNTLQLLSAQHYIATSLARSKGAGAMYVVPDWIYSENCLSAAFEIMQRDGKEIFAAPILLAGAEGMRSGLQGDFKPNDALSVSAPNLARLAVANLHSSWRQFVAAGDGFEARQIPTWMLWPFGEAGLVMHAFHWSVFLVARDGFKNYTGQRFWTIDHRFLDVLVQDEADWRRVAICRDMTEFLIVAHDVENKDYAWAEENCQTWDIDQIVAAVTPDMNLLGLSQANHMLYREPVIYNAPCDKEGCADALRLAESLVGKISGRLMDVSIRRA